MGKQYAFSCNKCFALLYPIPLYEALAYSKCPNPECNAPVGDKSDSVFWVCENCGNHNDYDWEKCYSCGK
jgi:hypothetical protein